MLQISTIGKDDLFILNDEVREELEKKITKEDKTNFHNNADKFYIYLLTELARELKIDLPMEDEARRLFFLSSNGFVDTLIHNPQSHQSFSSALNISVGWQEQLYRLLKYDEAASIVNIICFALARQGDRAYVKSLLVRIILVTKGEMNLSTRVNLATLLREENQYESSLRIYRGTILDFLWNRSYIKLAIVFSEMGSIYRQKGEYIKAIITLELCSLIHGVLRNRKSQAIARSQLSSAYRKLGLSGPALRTSNLACNYFKQSDDYLNLGRTLLTRGNIFLNLRNSQRALECFNESLSIGQNISDPQSICGSLSGKARALMLAGDLSQVKQLLDEAIATRQRYSDHSIGIEYQNLGYYYELSRNYQMALIWYEKALKILEQYMPGEVPVCKNRIREVESQMRKLKKNSY